MDKPQSFPDWCTNGDKSQPPQNKINNGWDFLPDPNNPGKYIIDIAVRQWVNFQYSCRSDWYKYFDNFFSSQCLCRDNNKTVTKDTVKINAIYNTPKNSVVSTDVALNLNYISINKLVTRDNNGNIDTPNFADQISNVSSQIIDIKNRLTKLENI